LKLQLLNERSQGYTLNMKQLGLARTKSYIYEYNKNSVKGQTSQLNIVWEIKYNQVATRNVVFLGR
jgi:hypothetical protein